MASGSRVSEALIAALEVLHGGDMAAVEAAVAALAWRQLAAMPTSLLHDLALLTADASACGDAEGLQLYARLLRHYTQVRVGACMPTECVHALLGTRAAPPNAVRARS